jgi:hypothetical protein
VQGKDGGTFECNPDHSVGAYSLKKKKKKKKESLSARWWCTPLILHSEVEVGGSLRSLWSTE